MLLSKILHNISFVENDIEINKICFDSRQVESGDLFVATRGTAVDGHDFIETAIEKGAVAVICEDLTAENAEKAQSAQKKNLCVKISATSAVKIIVKNSAETLGKIASNFYSNPSQHLKLIGVTGTNGKTTIATLLYQLTMSLGIKAGLLSTVCNYICGEKIEATHTTPDALELNRLLAEMVKSGCEYCFMEVSSHAVVQHRISGLEFAGGIFTNLTRDHLDYHGSMENYRDAKKLFFDNLPKTAFALTNLDDKNGEFILQNTKAQKFTYSIRTLADFKTKIIESDFDGMELLIEQRTKSKEQRHFQVYTPFVGSFNAQNLTAVFGAATLTFNNAVISSDSEFFTTNGSKSVENSSEPNLETHCHCGLDPQSLESSEPNKLLIVNCQLLIEKLSALVPVSGRFETIRGGSITAIVDYAHTPDALKNVLATINDIRLGGSVLITVVGCGGNRDKGKRPIMAQTAVAMSDQVIFTSDNPRDENPDDILADMLAGLSAEQKDKALTISDRRQAIKIACKLAKSGDVILIAGKGHENYQIIKGTKHHFDDKEEIWRELRVKN